MVADVHQHDLRWVAPHALWTAAGPLSGNGAAARPAILRFASERFMEELIATTATRPEALRAWLAVAETWREPAPRPPTEGLNAQSPLSFTRARLTRMARARHGATPAAPLHAAAGPLKLYQPAQDRFYLVAAQLVCERPGLPDRAVEAGKQEQVRFVVRRVVPPEGAGVPDPATGAGEEYAFVARGEAGYWKKLGAVERTRLQPEEERLPLFPLTYDAAGRKRRLLLGAVPVARREAYVGGPLSQDSATPPPASDPEGPSPRALLFRIEVAAPWSALRDQAVIAQETILEEPSGSDQVAAGQEVLRLFRARAQTAGWFLLLDFARFLQAHLPRVWSALKDELVDPPLSDEEEALVSAIEAIEMPEELANELEDAFSHYAGNVVPGLKAALTRLTEADAAKLEAVETEFDPAPEPEPNADDDPRDAWPDFLWLPAHPGVRVTLAGFQSRSQRAMPRPADAARVDELEALVEAALPATPAAPVPDIAAPAAAEVAQEAWFAIRCVYERPNCAGFARPVVSQPTAAFQMASFFDPDAPARAVRIPMPLDISPAALRKYKKGAGFILSDMFCGQFQRFKRVTLGDLVRSVLPWPLHKDLPGGAAAPCGGPSNPFGLFVSLSIPIVTVCAFILMLIMVALFDVVFRWLPYLLVVFRLPRLKGKRS